ncbi:MAG: serine/threonine protein kinase [Deltaproteobacteria bacterium]|nr:serine/threonine protein kinase [Deltaproteobacteria bacterium]
MQHLLSNLLGRFKPGASSAERRGFMRSRLALYCKLMFWSILILVGFINVMYAVFPETRPARATAVNIMAASGILMIGTAWLAARRENDYSEGVLTGIDVSSTLIIGAAFAVSAVLAQDRLVNVYSSFIWVSFAIFGRSLIVPSSGRRTLLLSILGTLPILSTALMVTTAVPRPALFVGALIFCAVIVVLSTVGSHVIYGLRQQVREAMQLGQYSLGDKIGEGGMGAVYKAKHAMLRRPTAIKLLRGDVASAEALQRFEREVQLTSELTHPNTIAIYDYGRSPDGVFYYAMEYLDGIDLEKMVNKYGPQPPERVVHILRQICGALSEAHGRGLIHRDIKPSNIIVSCRGDIADVAKILDFGLVKEMDKDDQIEGENTVSGTPAYLSPEAITDPDQISPRSDIYALGAVAYFLLSGKTPFEGKSVVQLCYHHLHTTPVRPSLRGDLEVPAEIEELVLQCLAKDPDARPSSAREMGKLLGRLDLAGQWTEDRARGWWDDDYVPRMETEERERLALTMTVDIGQRNLSLGQLLD